MSRSNHYCRNILAIVAFAAAKLLAQSPTSPAAETPKGQRVELRIGDGKHTTYHLGELVPVLLIYTDTEHTKRWVSYEPCNSPESYPKVVGPQSLATRNGEERAVFFIESMCLGHGWGGEIDMAERPWANRLTLNDRYLLDTPGTYDFVWTGASFDQKVITSNVARLILLPRDAPWDAAELLRADEILDSTSDISSEKRREGCQILRRLGTRATELDMARRFGEVHDVCGIDFLPALINAKARGEVFRILEEKITDPNKAINMGVIRALALLSIYRSHPELYVEVTQNTPPPPTGSKEDQWSLLNSETLRFVRMLVAVLPSKEPEARAYCIDSLLQYEQSPRREKFPPDVETMLRR